MLAPNYNAEIATGIIDSTVLDGGYVVALYEMYSDESENGNFITVAGFLFTKKHARKLEKEWHPVLKKHGLPYFHMVDCAHGNGSFESMRDNVDRRIKIQTRLFKTLKKYKSVGFAVSFDKRLSHLLPSSLNIGIEQVTPYSFCAYWIMVSARNWIENNSPDAKIAYYYEAGHKDESVANKIMQSLYTNEWHRNHFKIASYSFVNKLYSAAIQTGDILAWQWCKNVKERAKGNLKARKDLIYLIDDEKTYSTDFDEQQILEFIEIISRHSSEASF